MAIRRPNLTNADAKSELARKLVELVDAFNALETRVGTNEDTNEADISDLEAGRVEGRGTGSAGAIALWTDVNTIGANGNLAYDGSNLTVLDRLFTTDPGTTLQTGLHTRVNVGGTKTTPRVMMGPTENVGATFHFLTARGRNGTGAVTLTGAAVGDVVKFVQGMQLGLEGSGAAQYESTISIVNQIQQSSASDLTALNWLVVLERRSATGATTERPLYCVP